MAKERSMSKARRTGDIASYIVLTLLSILWVTPVILLIIQSFNTGGVGTITNGKWTLDNYINLFDTNQANEFQYLTWYKNTLFVAVICCIISTFFVLSVSYTMSRLRFKMRKPFMNIALILGMFPGFMSMIAVYHILNLFNLPGSLLALIMVYSGGAGLGFYVAKGFFDTIPKAIDEAAWIDGATKWQVFTKITMPLSKPIIVYTVLQSFNAPWVDFIFVSILQRQAYDKYTVAYGLYTMVDQYHIATYYNEFCAGAVLVAIPLTILFICMQKFYAEGLSGAVKG